MPSNEITITESKVLIQPIQEATTDASAPQDLTITWSSLYFLSLHIILVYIAPCFDVLYSRIGCITDDTSYIDIIFCLNLKFFYFLYSLTLMFSLKHVVSPIRLRLHVTQEVPLPPYFSIAFVTLRTMFSLVGGRVEEVSIVNNAKLFW